MLNFLKRIFKKKIRKEMADINGYVSPSGGYVNYAKFCVVGTNSITNRNNTKHYETQTEQDAIKMAKKEGLVEPFDVKVEPIEKPTDKQLNYALSLGAVIPDGACKDDLSYIISSIVDDDLYVPDASLSKYAHDCGLKFSRFIGRNMMMELIVNGLDDEQLAVFYTYCVYLQIKGGEIRDPRGLEIYNILEKIGRNIIEDESLVKSLRERPTYDYWGSHKGTKIYKSVNKALIENNVI